MPLTFLNQLSLFCDWLEATPLSQIIQKTAWIIPTIQIIHILAIASVAGAVLMINARLLRILDREQSLSSVVHRFAPVIWWALPVLLASGACMIIGEPARSLKNPVFQVKVVLILLAMAHTACLQARLPKLEASSRVGASEIVMALPAIAIWIGIVFAGRWIAYY